ncbi:unnamed protein product, partial [Brassica rapa subsp. narinosa]
KKKKSKQRYVVSSLNFLSPSHHRRFFSGLTISTRDEIPLTLHHLISSHLIIVVTHRVVSILSHYKPISKRSHHILLAKNKEHSSNSRDEIPIVSSHHGHSQISKQVHLKNVLCS